MVENQSDRLLRSKRVRTGCRQCRVRRRKCDEEKPKCRNCITKGTQCQYGPRLTFLSKNAYTVRQPTKLCGPSRTSERYEEIQFVHASSPRIPDHSTSGTRRTDNRGSKVASAPENDSSKHQHRDSNENHEREDEGHPSDVNQSTPCTLNERDDGNDASRYSYSEDARQKESPLSSRRPAMTGRSPSEGDRSAVQGLLALGLTTSITSPSIINAETNQNHFLPSPDGAENWNPSQSHAHQTADMNSRETELLREFEANTRLGSFTGCESQCRTSVDSAASVNKLFGGTHCFLSLGGASISGPMARNAQQQDTRSLQLLRFYRYKVATWLDICDMNQSFGITATELALGSAPFGPLPDTGVLRAIFALTETSIKQLKTSLNHNYDISFERLNDEGSTSTPILDKSSAEMSGLAPRESFSQFDDLEIDRDFLSFALCASLARVNNGISNVYRFWTETGMSVDYLSLVGSLVPYASEKSLRSAIYWLLLRLDLSIGLINPASHVPTISMSFALRAFDLETSNDPYQNIFQYAHVPVMLCAQAVILSNGDIANRSSTSNTADSWMRLTQKLNQWYLRRPSEFQPMLDIDSQNGHDSNFPVLLFTNGAGIVGNQLYHTAMCLLLQHKPRTSQLTHIDTPARSFLWHARRICGIALHNDRRQCWDLSLLASFFIASKTMTYRPQQLEILQGLHRIQDTTGWDVSDLVAALQVEWSAMED